MEVLGGAANIAGVLSLGIQVAKTLLEYYNDYRGREADVSHTIKKLDRLLGMLESLRTHLEDHRSLPRDPKMTETIQSAIQDCEDCIGELSEQCIKFKDAPSTGIKAKAITAARRLSYPLRRSTLDAIDETVDEIASHISLALQIIQQKAINNVQAGAEEIKALLELVRADQVSRNVRDWLAAPDMTSNYYAACRCRSSGTGNWLVKGNTFKTWLSSPNSLLWLYGFAGCGKSVLCSTAIQHTFRHRNSNPRIGIAFFFFTFNDNSKQDASAMLRAIVLQLAGQLKDGEDMLAGLHQRHNHGTPPDEALIACLRSLIRSSVDTYIIVDALDECPRDEHRGRLLQVLIDLRGWSEDRLHLLFTSRDEPDIREAIDFDMKIATVDAISLKNESVDSDIESFIIEALKSDRRLRRWKDFHDEIQESLTQRAKGVFRWVECQFTALVSCARSKRQLDSVLASLPRSLDETYERMLGNIAPESKEDARRLLTLLCYSARPLTVAEVIEGIAVELGEHPRLNTDGRMESEEDILHLCPGLVEIDRHSDVFGGFQDDLVLKRDRFDDAGFFQLFRDRLRDRSDDAEFFQLFPDSLRSTVRIAHFSVQEYLESGRILDRPVSGFGVRLEDAHAEIGSICLTYLLGLASDMWHPECALAPYAAQHWPKHYRNANLNKFGVRDQAVRLLAEPNHRKLEHWSQVWRAVTKTASSAKVLVPIFYASAIGLNPLLLDVLNNEPYRSLSADEMTNLINDEGCPTPPLLQAVRGGSLEVVETLVKRGANVNIDSNDSALLLEAVILDESAIVRFLVEQGADVERVFKHHRMTAMQAAIRHGRTSMVELFLDHGANMEATGLENDLRAHKSLLAFALASSINSFAILQLLLDRGARATPNDLVKAARDGHMRLLLEHATGLDLNDESFAAAIDSIMKMENICASEVQFLLGKGARYPQASSLLMCSMDLRCDADQSAARWLGQFLLDKGAEIGVPAHVNEHAAETVAAYGLMDIAEQLLGKCDRCDSGVRKDCYSTALQYAASLGQTEAVRLLLEKGGDPNYQGGRYSSALYAAVMGGSETTVRLLVESGADVNLMRDGSGTAFQKHESELPVDPDDCLFIDECGTETTVRLLVESGADVNLMRDESGTAFQKHESELPVDPDDCLFIDECGTALQIATHLGHEAIARLLVEKGADVNLRRDKRGFAPEARDAIHRRWERSMSSVNAKIAAQGDPPSPADDFVRLLREGGEYNDMVTGYESSLYWAASSGQDAIARLLIDNGADINTANGPEYTALYAAIFDGHDTIVRLLIDNGADINTANGPECTALYVAIIGGHDTIVRLLIDNGADINTASGPEGPVLYVAAMCGYDTIVKLLMDKGADINTAKGPYGTALHAAARFGYDTTVRLLVDKGANVNDIPCSFDSVLRCAVESKEKETVKLVLECGAHDTQYDESLRRDILHMARKSADHRLYQLVLAQDAIRGKGRSAD